MTPIFTVGELTQIIKSLFDNSNILQNIYIRGEISNFKHHLSGHMYFTLKDEKSQIRCIMFRNKSALLPFIPENGMKVILFGSISVFVRAGEYQIYVEDIQPDGIGALHIAFEKLKVKLEKEGLFDKEKKKPIPFLPSKIGIITSLTGAAIKDLITVIKRRFSNVDIYIAPVLVQGKAAAGEICAAIHDLNEIKEIDVIILGRGGGSIEELWPFNEESVARAIYSSKIPIISAVGHETDYTISDFIADKRAPTPSAAGEMVVPEKLQLTNDIKQYAVRLTNAVIGNLNFKKQKLEFLKRSPAFTRPDDLLTNSRMLLDQLLRQLNKEINLQLDKRKQAFLKLTEKLDALSPLSILKRGYSICEGPDGKIIKKVDDSIGYNRVRVVVSDGILLCEVKGSRKVEENEERL
ncbi:MAG: exodeoxyribonuclease VII large subunit [Thermoanaerobacterales bacterium]|nr:exodeoxyribonuclease VII large subunit [Thermoanaerobacterales bacterium]